MTREEGPRQKYRRLRRSYVHTFQGTTRVGAVHLCAYGRRDPHPVAAVLCFLLAGILVSPIFDSVAWTRGVGFGVLAAPCGTGSATAGTTTTVNVSVTPTTGLDHAMFNCEGGDFRVFWAGVVHITETINIGPGTTVHIMGDRIPDDTSDTAPISMKNGSTHSVDSDNVDDWSAMLSIPRGLTSAAVRVPSSTISAADNKSIPLGPIFHVDGGDLFLEKMAVRGGYVTNSTKYPTASGAGIYAQHANVTVTSCEFEDNFAELNGGGIFANASTLTVISSAFRRCRAGFRPQTEEETFVGGGGINSNITDTLIVGCLFEECYASKKGGGMRLGDGGKMSILTSVFYNNSVGSDNVKDEEAVGEAGALSIDACDLSFDGARGCSINDTVFINNHAARKGGAFNMGSGLSPSYVEMNRCTVVNSSAGVFIEDDPQGKGGVFNLSPGHRLVLSDSVFIDNRCGDKGAVISLSSGTDWKDAPGATVTLRNSKFDSNAADGNNAGVVSMGEYTTLVVAGVENLFQNNTCGGDGAVFGGTTSTNITVEGGVFEGNFADGDGGVMWTKGTVEVSGGRFRDNGAKKVGGVVILGDEGTIVLDGGDFEGNEASDGGVVFVGSDAKLSVSGGEFMDNKASNFGGAFFVDNDGMVEITGGHFTENKADFGGFLYKEGKGNVSCKGAVIEKSEGVDGGAIYAVDSAVLNWACDLNKNTALAGPAIYARDETTVILTGVSLVDNAVARGAVVFVAESNLKTYEVEFKDTTKSSDLSAVQVDEESSYMAVDTSFVGFQGEAVVFSEGALFLDDCDFSGSTAPQLVYAEPDSTVVIRNIVLGDNNYFSLAEASSLGGKLPTADSLTNANVTCQDAVNGGDTASPESSDANTICSEGYECLDGDVGVYCECYLERSTMEKRCANGNAAALDFNLSRATNETFFPDMLEGDLLLSHVVSAAGSRMTSTNKTEASLSENKTRRNRGHGGENGTSPYGGGQSGVVWKVSALPQLSDNGRSMMNWTIFPSSGLLLPGQSVTLRVVTLPSPGFDGNTLVTFDASGMGSSVVSSESLNVTFFHCEIGQVWNATAAGLDSPDGDSTEACQLCIDVVGEDTRGVNCDEPGATIESLPIEKGHWRAGRDVVVVRECTNEDACKGGTIVKDVQEYCTDGYKGPECSVCASGYGRGTASQCHRCTESFKTGMVAIVAILAVFALVVMALLVVYLIGGGEAVSSTVSSTKRSVQTIKRRGSVLLARSEGGGVIDFNTQYGPNTTNSDDIPGNIAQGMQMKKLSVRGPGSSSTTHSVPGIDPASSSSGRNLVGGSGRALLAGRIFPKKSCFSGRAASVRPHSPTPKLAGGPFVTPMRVRGVPLPSTPQEPKSPQTVRDASIHGDTVDTTRSTGHRHTNSSGIPGQQWTSELQQGYATPPATGAGLEHSTGNISQSQLSREQADVEGSVRNGALPQSPEGSRAGNGEGDNTAGAFIGNMLMELPLSKIKIVIVVWQISAAFSNITNVGYPPIYEKFLSFIGIFSLDLAWILSAACLTTEVNFYDKLLMVTIGPLAVLGLLGVTFHIGAKHIGPVATNLPTSPQADNKAQSNNNVLQMAEHIGSDPVSHRENTSDSPSSQDVSQDVSQVMKLPRFGAVLQRESLSGESGDTMALSRSEHPTTSAANFAGRLLSADGNRQSLESSTANREDIATEESRGVAGSLNTPVSEDISPSKAQRSLGSMLGAGIGNEANTEEDRLFARHTTMTLILLYLVYSQVSTVVFQTFSCEAFPEISKSFLRADLSIQCDTDTHKAYRIYAAVMIFLYPLGIPAAFYFLLSRQRSSINPPTDKVVKELRGTLYVVREKIKQRSTDRSIAPTSFLWNAYYPNRYYYEVFECLRRLVLTGLLVFLVPDTSGQVAFSCVFAFASLLAFELQRPHIDSLEIQIYRTGCLVIFFTNFLALMIKADVADEHSTGSAFYSVVLIMVNVMFFLSIWWNTWAAVKLTFTRRGFQGAILGVDVVGEDIVDTFLGSNKQERPTVSLVNGADTNPSPVEERPVWGTTPV